MQVREKEPEDQPWIEKMLRERWGGVQVIVHNEMFKSVFARQQGLTASSYRRHDHTPDGVAFKQMRQFGKATDCLNESDYQEHYQDE